MQLAITSETIPREVASAPVAAGLDAEGCVWLQPSVSIRRVDLAALKHLGVEQKRSTSVATASLRCWHQLLSLRSVDVDRQEQREVLFCLDDRKQLPEIVNEMLRLGNDRQRFACVTESSVDGGEMCLLNVVDPPLYTLLRATDATAGPVAFTSPAPRVWVEYGFRHPLAQFLQPPADQWLLIRSDRTWQWIESPALTDVYRTLDFRPAGEVVSSPSKREPDRIVVPVRLRESSSVAPAELWVVQADSMAQMESLLKRSNDGLLGRLAFAVTADTLPDSHSPTVVLKARPSTLPPLVLVLDALACRPYLRIPNLFLPLGQQLQPPLRRDAVIQLLAEDADRIHWLAPSALVSSESVAQGDVETGRECSQPSAGSFNLHSIDDAAFRPLEDWVDYVIDHQARHLNAWIASHQFDFASFVCRDSQPGQNSDPAPRPQSKPLEMGNEPGSEESIQDSLSSNENPAAKNAFDVGQPAESLQGKRNDLDTVVDSPPRPALKQDQWQLELRQLEESYRDSDAPLDSETRTELWIELGAMNARLNRPHDTTICFANGLWRSDASSFGSAESPSRLQAWLRGELRCAGISDLDATELDARLNADNAQDHQPGLIVAKIVATVADGGDINLFASRQASVIKYLLHHERRLPVRAVWLAWLAMYRMGGNDLLLLARARDRLLERLFDRGLAPEFDLPVFLRTDATGESERLRLVRDRAGEFYQIVRRWVLEPDVGSHVPQTKGYVDLLFAYAMARLGETVTCQNLMAKASDSLAMFLCGLVSSPRSRRHVSPGSCIVAKGTTCRRRYERGCRCCERWQFSWPCSC